METLDTTSFEIVKCDEVGSFCTVTDHLQLRLVNHFQDFHYGDVIDGEEYLQHCNCQESKSLQAQIINHMLSHLVPKIIKEEIIEEFICEEVEEEVTYDPVKIVIEEPTSVLNACKECDAKYKTWKALKNHIKSDHDPQNPFICPYAPLCKNRFADEKKLMVHTNRHEAELSLRDDGNYYCRICEKKCATKDLLISHKATHFHDYSCDYCGRTFTKKTFLENHIIQHVFGRQKKEKQKIICELCSQWVQRDRMKRHLYQFHSDKKDFKCTDCGKEFKYANSFKEHLDMHRNNPRFKCGHCNKKFYNGSNYRNHLLKHTEPDRFKCTICQERYVNLKSLNNHMARVHVEKKKKLHCPYGNCEKFYYIDTALTNHIQRAHTKSKEETIECSLCEFSASNIKNLHKHLWRVHKVQQEDNYFYY